MKEQKVMYAGNDQPRSKLNRRTILQGTVAVTVGLGLVTVGTVVYATDIEPTWFEITRHRVVLPHLASAFEGYRLVHISDIHADNDFMTAQRLAGLVETINSYHPDAVVITGDFVTDYRPGAEHTVAVLKNLHASDGVFGVMGNHDHPAGIAWVREGLQLGHIEELANRTYTIRRNNQLLHLVGLDDLWPSNIGTPASIWTHQTLLRDLTDTLPAEGAALLLVHEPDFADVAAENGRLDLQLSGHSHGGQVRLPLHGPIFTPPLSRVYPMGWYDIHNLKLYTNRGLGMLTPYVRFNCRPEIAIMELTSINKA